MAFSWNQGLRACQLLHPYCSLPPLMSQNACAPYLLRPSVAANGEHWRPLLARRLQCLVCVSQHSCTTALSPRTGALAPWYILCVE